MVSDQTSSMANGGNLVAEKPLDGSLTSKKCQGKVPKKVHKAEREKLKRDQLNDLFTQLGNMLEPDRQNSGKAFILADTTRILRDLITQVESLRKENAALLTESHYVTAEKNDMRHENTVLQAEISELQNELRARMGYDPVWSHNPNVSTLNLHHPSTVLPLQQQQQPPVTAPPRELQLFPEAATTADDEPSAPVRRPHARYPTSSDSWPGQLLPRTGQEEQCSSGITGSSREED